MSDLERFAAIWPLKATSKSDYQIVSAAWIKNFKEVKNHGQTLYKFKPPGAKQSSLVFILVTGSSEEEVRKCLAAGRIRYPNKSLVEPSRKVSTSEEEKKDTTAQKTKNLKNQGKISTMQSILKNHISKIKTPSKINVKAAKKLSTSTDSSAKTSFLSQQASPIGTGGTLESGTAALTSAISSEKNADIRPKKLSTPKTQIAVKNSASQTDDIFVKQLTALEAKVTKHEEDITILDVKFQTYQVETQKQMDVFSQKLAILEKKSANKSTGHRIETQQKSNLPSTSKGPSCHLSSTTLIPLGHGVEADADVWETMDGLNSKDDWAYAALFSVFGAESKFYRARKPRLGDPNLRVFPDQPPVIFVLKHFYKKWLRNHPNVLDNECSRAKLPEDSPYEDWPTLFETETEAERDLRRKTMMTSMLKQLPGLMADKAINMYRQGHRSTGRDGDSDENVSGNDDEDADEVDIVEISSNEDDNFTATARSVAIKKEVASGDDSSSSELSPNSRQFLGLA